MRKLRLIVSALFLLVSIAAATRSAIQAQNHPSKDPAAPQVGCDTSCHNEPKYKKEDTYRKEECIVCHMKAEDVAREKLLVAEAAKTAKPGPATAAAPGMGKKKKGPYLVKNQKAALKRLKGKPRALPGVKRKAPTGMVYIPAGEFLMGSSERWSDESPEHVWYLDDYFIDKYEVTNSVYRKFVQATGRRPPDHWPGGRFPEDLAYHPVVYVSWYDAQAYCQWAEKRLPLEQEWEKAGRGTDGRTYPWGNEFDESKSNNAQKESKGTEPVGSYESGKSPYGLYDMSGNVWEWVDAWYKPHPGNTTPSEEYGEKYKVSKGGSWYNCLFYNCGISGPTYNRSFFVPETKNNSMGFRCAKDGDP